jgi:WD40 repeat protein
LCICSGVLHSLIHSTSDKFHSEEKFSFFSLFFTNFSDQRGVFSLMSSLRSFLPSSAKKQVVDAPAAPAAAPVSDDPFASLPKSFGRRAAPVVPPPPMAKKTEKRERNEFGELVKTKEEKKIEAERAAVAAKEKTEKLYQVRQGVKTFGFGFFGFFFFFCFLVEDEKHRPVPWSDELVMSSHTKTVFSLDFEPSGARLVSAGSDYSLKLWDFNGMDGSFQPCRSIEPREAHSVRWCRYNRKGGRILVAPGGNQAKIYSREGEEELEFQKVCKRKRLFPYLFLKNENQGDMYLVQMSATKGHCASVTSCEWNPQNKEHVLTSSLDLTCRIWDVNERKWHLNILLGPKQAGKRNGYCVAQYAPDATMIVSALLDGTLQVWDTRGTLKRADLTATYSTNGGECSSIAFDSNSRLMATRSGTEMMLWDVRLIKEPVHIWTDLADGPNSCIFSPDDTLLVTPGAGTKLQSFSRTTFALVEEREMGEPFHQVCWHPKLNQIACGMRSGVIKILYNSELSVKGALLCAARPVRKKEEDLDWDPGMGVIHNPDVEEEESRKKRKTELSLNKKRNLTKPDLPVQGVGAGGQVGTSQQHQLMKRLLKLDEYVPEDPRQVKRSFSFRLVVSFIFSFIFSLGFAQIRRCCKS